MTAETLSSSSLSIRVLAVLAGVYALKWAAVVIVPVMLGVLLSYTLSPIVERLYRWRIPRVVGAGVLLLALVAGTGSLLYTLADDATALIELLPSAAQRLRVTLQKQPQAAPGTFDNVQKAAAELERAASEGGAPEPPERRGVTRVQIERPRFRVQDYVWTGTLGLLSVASRSAMVILIAFFLLASGDSFRRKLVRLAGPKMSQKRITLEGLDELAEQIQKYLLVQLVLSVLVGLATWLAFAWIGLQHAAVWGVVAAVGNLIPYVGAACVGAASTLMGFVQFGTIETAVVIGGVSFVIHGLIGHLLTPWLTGRAGRMNAVAVFVGVLVWGWLWGLPGLLMGVPILMIVKAACDRVDELKPVGELLGT